MPLETGAAIIANDYVWGTEENPTPENATQWLIDIDGVGDTCRVI